jgi:urease accessory protein
MFLYGRVLPQIHLAASHHSGCEAEAFTSEYLLALDVTKLRATAVRPHVQGEACDSVILAHDSRYRRRVTMRTEGDLVFLLDLPEPTRLTHGDGLVLEDGRVIQVVAAEEPVMEITARDAHHLTRIAWHLGNRHLPTEILPDRIRIAPDSVIEDMVRALGGTVQRVETRFEPEGGAYAHGHDHHHD